MGVKTGRHVGIQPPTPVYVGTRSPPRTTLPRTEEAGGVRGRSHTGVAQPSQTRPRVSLVCSTPYRQCDVRGIVIEDTILGEDDSPHRKGVLALARPGWQDRDVSLYTATRDLKVLALARPGRQDRHGSLVWTAAHDLVREEHMPRQL